MFGTIESGALDNRRAAKLAKWRFACSGPAYQSTQAGRLELSRVKVGSWVLGLGRKSHRNRTMFRAPVFVLLVLLCPCGAYMAGPIALPRPALALRRLSLSAGGGAARESVRCSAAFKPRAVGSRAWAYLARQPAELRRGYASTYRVWKPEILEGAAATLTTMWKVQLAAALTAAAFSTSCFTLLPKPVVLSLAGALSSRKALGLSLMCASVPALLPLLRSPRLWLAVVFRFALYYNWIPTLVFRTLLICALGLASGLPVYVLVAPPHAMARKSLLIRSFASWLDAPLKAYHARIVAPVLTWMNGFVALANSAAFKNFSTRIQTIRWFWLTSFIIPFSEELAFRGGLQRVALGKEPSQRRRSLAYAFVAVIFSLAHLGNSWSTLLESVSHADFHRVSSELGLLLNQLMFTFLASYHIYSPVFSRFGFRAVVGAHMTWNIVAGCLDELPRFVLEKSNVLPIVDVRLNAVLMSILASIGARLCANRWLGRRAIRTSDATTKAEVDLIMGNRAL